METTELKDSVIKYLENADEKLVRMIKALIDSYEEESDHPDLNEEHYKEIEHRRKEYLEDPGASHTWEQVKDSIRNASIK